VKNNAINITEIGADPAVRINPAVYPVPGAVRVDNNNSIGLTYFETENTYIPYKELHGYPIEKEGSVIMDHRKSLEEQTAAWSTYNLSIDQAAAKKYVVEATGAANASGYKAVLAKDIATLKKKYDDDKVPVGNNRILILSSMAVNDLLNEDKAFTTQYNNHKDGLIVPNFYGFKIYEDRYTPWYTAAGVKLAWGAVPSGTNRPASVSLYLPRTWKAKGDLIMSSVDVRSNPSYRRSEIGFNHWYGCGFKKMEYAGVIVQPQV